MVRIIKTKKEVEGMLINAVGAYLDVCIADGVTAAMAGERYLGLKLDEAIAESRVKTLMEIINVPPGWFDDVLKGGLDCDRCGDPFLACLAQVGMFETVLCEECKIEEDPIIAMQDALLNNSELVVEVMDHRTDEDGITESFPTIVRVED